METYEFDVTSFEDAKQNEADKKLVAIFYKTAIKNEAKSAEAGRPIFDERDMIRILTPGSKDTFEGDATEEYRARFPQQWARYKANQDQMNLGGTPINSLPWLSIGQIAELKALNVHTVEQLAGMSDSMSQKFMGHHQMKQRAQAFLDAAADSAPLMKMEAELNKRDDVIAELRRANELMAQRLTELERANEQSKGAKQAVVGGNAVPLRG